MPVTPPEMACERVTSSPSSDAPSLRRFTAPMYSSCGTGSASLVALGLSLPLGRYSAALSSPSLTGGSSPAQTGRGCPAERVGCGALAFGRRKKARSAVSSGVGAPSSQRASASSAARWLAVRATPSDAFRRSMLRSASPALERMVPPGWARFAGGRRADSPRRGWLGGPGGSGLVRVAGSDEFFFAAGAPHPSAPVAAECDAAGTSQRSRPWVVNPAEASPPSRSTGAGAGESATRRIAA